MSRIVFALLVVAAPLLASPGPALGQDLGTPDVRGEATPDQEEPTAGGAEIFLGAFRAIRNHHLSAYEDSLLWEKAVDGLIDQLEDPYATVFSPDEFSQFQESNTGNYAGIGVRISQMDDRITVTAVFRGTPAEDVGLQVGDRIVSINGSDARGWTVQEASDSIRGPAGTTVDLGIAREGTADDLPFTVPRDNVHVPAVTAHSVQDSIGYLLVERVARNSAHEVDSALTELRGSRGLIVDLRRNPGGYLDEALDLADLFLEPGQLVASARSRVPGGDGETREETWEAESAARLDGTPIVVLVDEYTASASEIVAGALQDHDRALVLGERTFGKGVVQTVMRIPGDRRIRLTTGSWYTPLGRSLHRPRDLQGRALPDASDTAEVVHTGSGRTLRAGGGVFPDVPVADDTLSTAEQDLVREATSAGIPLNQRVTEAAFRQARLHGDAVPDDAGLVDPGILDELVVTLGEDGVPEEVLQHPDVRPYLSWRLRIDVANRLDDPGRALAIRMERDRVLAEAVRLIRRADTQGDLFAAASREEAREADAAGTVDAGHPASDGARSGSSGGS